jgi:hypothetical protein
MQNAMGNFSEKPTDKVKVFLAKILLRKYDLYNWQVNCLQEPNKFIFSRKSGDLFVQIREICG